MIIPCLIQKAYWADICLFLSPSLRCRACSKRAIRAFVGPILVEMENNVIMSNHECLDARECLSPDLSSGLCCASRCTVASLLRPGNVLARVQKSARPLTMWPLWWTGLYASMGGFSSWHGWNTMMLFTVNKKAMQTPLQAGIYCTLYRGSCREALASLGCFCVRQCLKKMFQNTTTGANCNQQVLVFVIQGGRA